MPAKTSTTPTTSASAPTYMRLLRGTLSRRPTSQSYDADGQDDAGDSRQMSGSCGNGQMVAGRADDPALVHF
ncbi:MAG: hypothetical protein PW843_01080 [Azospirillaceae bacterium]|nr:hypothetical protein [Azospirillaceae bacterium]